MEEFKSVSLYDWCHPKKKQVYIENVLRKTLIS